MNRLKGKTKIVIYFLHAVLLAVVFLPLIFALVSSFRPLEDLYKYIRPLSIETFITKNLEPL